MEALKKWTFQNFRNTTFEMKVLVDVLINRLNTIEEKVSEMKDRVMSIIVCGKEKKLKSIYF